MAEGCIHPEPFAKRRSPAQACHLGRRAGLVDKNQTMGLKAHARQTQPDPLIALLGDLGAILLAGQQRFF